MYLDILDALRETSGTLTPGQLQGQLLDRFPDALRCTIEARLTDLEKLHLVECVRGVGDGPTQWKAL